jgi:hypothetical protein
MSPSQTLCNVNIDAVDPLVDPTESLEPSDITDADAFEALAQRNSRSTITSNQDAIDANTAAEVSNVPTEQTTPFNIPDLETSATVVISCFPFGMAGTPIPSASVTQGSLAHKLDEATSLQSVWAPFVSQCDWQVAQWAKMHGSTSSAVTDLLAIEEVHTHLGSDFIRS